MFKVHVGTGVVVPLHYLCVLQCKRKHLLLPFVTYAHMGTGKGLVMLLVHLQVLNYKRNVPLLSSNLQLTNHT